MNKPKYKYYASTTGLIYRIKPDWKQTGENEFLHRDATEWAQGANSTIFFDKSPSNSLYPLAPSTVKFFEQNGYRYACWWKGEE